MCAFYHNRELHTDKTAIAIYNQYCSTGNVFPRQFAYMQSILKSNQVNKAYLVSGNIAFKYPKDTGLLNILKQQQFKYSASTQMCSISLSFENYELLKTCGYEFGNQLKIWAEQFCPVVESVNPVQLSGFKKQLYKYQLEGIDFIERNFGNALIGDDMGLGKGIQALYYLFKHPEIRPALVICPASLKLNWNQEIKDCFDERGGHVLEGRTVEQLKSDIVIINYDIVKDWLDVLFECGFKAVIIDEIHYLQNAKTSWTKAIKILSRVIPNKIGLSGTPVMNRPIELYSILRILSPKLFPSYIEYGIKYCNARLEGGRWNMKGACNTQELHKILTSSIMIRRKKEDVLSELPKKRRSVISLKLSNMKEYLKKEMEFVDWNTDSRDSTDKKKTKGIPYIDALLQLAFKGKQDSIAEFIDTFFSAGEKIVVGCTHLEALKFFKERYISDSVFCTSAMSSEERQEAKNRFQTDKSIYGFFTTLKVGGVGLTLTAACNTCTTELTWNPAIHDQFEDRVCRITQTRPVNSYFMIADNTIESTMVDMLDRKRKVITSIQDGKEVKDFDMLGTLLEKYRRK